MNEQIVWKQVQVVQKNAKGESITIHYQYNSTTGKAYDIKIYTPQRVSSNPADVIENIKGLVNESQRERWNSYKCVFNLLVW